MADWLSTDPAAFPDETWTPLAIKDGYEISRTPRVRSLPGLVPRHDGGFQPRRGKILKLTLGVHGYYVVNLGRNNLHCVHELVALAFHGPKPPGMEVLHANGDRTDNRPENLSWGTHAANMQDRTRHGRDPQANLTHCPYGHLYEAPNLVLGRLPGRICLACKKAHVIVARLRKHGLPADHQAISDEKYAQIMRGEITQRRRRAS